ncbi:MAG: ATP-binding cassette domain-containing protein [Coriobacteriales bacterium]|jgi:polar amino acid transport system ATP-binding protein|nr:ATP-binding cassette domain-containing protein [Coriobacteriales bacterium]
MHLRLENISKHFNGTEVLRQVCLADEIGKLAIVGPSGSGKTTLLRIIGGLLQPSEGHVFVDGSRVDYSENKLPHYRAGLGYVFQQNGLFHHLSARKNIALPLQVVHGVSEEESLERAQLLLERFGLVHEGDKLPAQLSGGQQQRAALARAIAASPKLVLLDEPTSALDPEYTNEVLDVINDLGKTGIRFIIVTHEMGFARHACDNLLFLYGGELLEYGTSSALFENPRTLQLQRFLSKLLEWRV